MALSISSKNKLLDKLIYVLDGKVSKTFYCFDEIVIILTFNSPTINNEDTVKYIKELIKRKIIKTVRIDHYDKKYETTIADLYREKRMVKLKFLKNE